jgi:hypothetical protein
LKKRHSLALLAVLLVAALLAFGLVAARSRSALLPATPDMPGGAATATPAVTETQAPAPSRAPAPTLAPTEAPTPAPTPTRVVEAWQWVKPGFSGRDAPLVTNGIPQYVSYNWSAICDAPARHQTPMIWGKKEFYQNPAGMAKLFNGSCNDGRPLLFLNEPAKVEQANITPVEAAHMFFTMTRGVAWPYERWHGPIYAGNNLVEERSWDAEFVRQFAKLHNDGRTAIPEIAGWGVHVYGNYEYGPQAGDPNVVWTEDIPPAEIPGVVDRSMGQLDAYLAERTAEGNSNSLAVTEFGLLQASAWHNPPKYLYTTTASFMEEYVKRFDARPEVQAWFWFISAGAEDEFLNVDLMVDRHGYLTHNGVKWRELAKARQQ